MTTADRYREGHITVYLALLLSLICALLVTVLESARYGMMRMRVEGAMDMSLNGVFAEYHRELLNEYDLFFIDSSYGNVRHAPENTAEHIRLYMNRNFGRQAPLPLDHDFLALQADNCRLTKYILASDESGLAFRKQAASYIKNNYGLDILEKISDQLSEALESGTLEKVYDDERNANEKEIAAVEIPPRQVGEDQWEEVKLNNPADEVNTLRGSGMMTAVTEKTGGISHKAIDVSAVPSKRMLETGNLLQPDDIPRLYVEQYLTEKLSSYTSLKEKRSLDYELEYILYGHGSDVENLQEVFNKLILIREAGNMAHLFSNGAKQAEAEALAAATAAAVGVPTLTPLIKLSILFAWGYAESVVDMRLLLSGKRVPLLKTAADWNVSLSGMKNCLDIEGNDSGKGLFYKDYLRILLRLQPEENIALRAMDMIECSIRNTAGNGYFCIDGCISYLEAEVNITSGFGYDCTITRSFGYEHEK